MNKKEVFISHITEESPVALVLQKHLRRAFGDAVPVFVSSDKTSIPSGQPWYNHIVGKLRDSGVVIVLLSQKSARREWISFEAGVGLGAEAHVIPLSLSRFSFSQLKYPLAGLQGRSIDDIGYVIDEVANACKVPKN